MHTTAFFRRLSLVLVLLLFTGCALLYSLLVPAWEAPDEPAHFAFVRSLARTHTLPIQPTQPGQSGLAEGHQPPLYYALGALLIGGINTDDFVVTSNPFLKDAPDPAAAGYARVVHSPAEDFPYRGTYLALHLVRCFSVLLGALTVLLSYRIGLLVFQRHGAALVTAILVAAVPQFAFLSGSVNNDTLAITLSALILCLNLQIARAGISRRILLLLGLSLGLGALAKPNVLILLPVTALALAYGLLRDRRRTWQAMVTAYAVPGALLVLIAGWWYLRNLMLYGEPLGTTTQTYTIGAFIWRQGWTQQDLIDFGRISFASFWGTFGWMNVPFPDSVYTVLQYACGVVLLGCLAGGVRQIARQQWAGLAVGILIGLTIVVGTLAYIRYAFVFFSAFAFQGRLLFPILPALAVLATFGLRAWLPAQVRPLLAFAAPVVLLAGLAVPFVVLVPVYRHPAPVPPAVLVQATPQQLTFAQLFELKGSSQTQQGNLLALTLIWQVEQEPQVDYGVVVQVVTQDGHVVAEQRGRPFGAIYPTRLWQPGELLAQPVALALPPDLAAGSYHIRVGWYDMLAPEQLLALQAQAGEPRYGVLAHLQIGGGTQACAARNEHVFGTQIQLCDQQVVPQSLAGRQVLTVTLSWSALRPIDTDYTVFVQLLDSSGKLQAQQDAQPYDGRYPTSEWGIGEVVTNDFQLHLPPAAPDGQYQIITGFYDTKTGERLRLADGNDHLVVQTIRYTKQAIKESSIDPTRLICRSLFAQFDTGNFPVPF